MSNFVPICPMISIAKTQVEKCRLDRCAWWNIDSAVCAILSMSIDCPIVRVTR